MTHLEQVTFDIEKILISLQTMKLTILLSGDGVTDTLQEIYNAEVAAGKLLKSLYSRKEPLQSFTDEEDYLIEELNFQMEYIAGKVNILSNH